MKRILYASGDFLTHDTVADALMEYAGVLAIIDSADVISIPGIDQDGEVREIRMLIGPASQIVSMSTDEPEVALDAEAAVAELHDRSERRLPSSIQVGAAGNAQAESDAESASNP